MDEVGMEGQRTEQVRGRGAGGAVGAVHQHPQAGKIAVDAAQQVPDIGALQGVHAVVTAALPVSVEAAQDSQVLLLDCQRVIHTCSDACIFHQRLAANLLKIVERQNKTIESQQQTIDRLTKKMLEQ